MGTYIAGASAVGCSLARAFAPLSRCAPRLRPAWLRSHQRNRRPAAVDRRRSDPTDDPSVQSLYVADYGNNHTTATASDDGRIFEIHLGDRAPLLLSRANAPTIIEVVDDVDPVSGSLVSGSKTNDSDLAVTVSLVGTGAIAGNAVQLYDGTGTTTTMGVAQVLSTADIAAGFASLQTGALTDATTYNITARITDPAGNQSGASNRFTVTEDRTAPAAPTQLSLDPSTDSGTKGDGFTSFTAVKIDGTAEPGSTVTVNVRPPNCLSWMASMAF